MEVSLILEELKFAGMRLGEQSVIKHGVHLMLMLHVDNLVMLHLVCLQVQALLKSANNVTSIGIPRYNAFYGQGTGPLLLDDLICNGRENRLIDCTHGGIGMTDFCRGHLDDAGLECRESMS